MAVRSSVFEETYRDYLNQVAGLDMAAQAAKLGLEIDAGDVIIPFFGEPHRVSDEGIVDPFGKQPIHAVSVVLCKYLLLCPDAAAGVDEWVSYRDFKDAAPFAGAFANNTERAIARNFSGRLDSLKEACRKLGGRSPQMDLAYEIAMRFDPLPRVPLLLLFNDTDEDFPAQCSVLFERRAEKYLDMECLAILGWLLADYLGLAAGLAKISLA